MTPDAVQGDVEHGVPLLVGHLGQGRRAAQTGVVDKDVEAAQLAHDPVEHGLHVVLVGDVARHGQHTTQLGRRLRQPPLVLVADGDRRTFFDTPLGRGEADAGAGRRRDEQRLALEQSVARRIGRNVGHGLRPLIVPPSAALSTERSTSSFARRRSLMLLASVRPGDSTPARR
jgi:hypothetical protein